MAPGYGFVGCGPTTEAVRPQLAFFAPSDGPGLVAAGLVAGLGGATRPASTCLSFASSCGLGGSGLLLNAGSSVSQTTLISFCMLPVSAVIARTASCSGMTMQNWPFAPSPR